MCYISCFLQDVSTCRFAAEVEDMSILTLILCRLETAKLSGNTSESQAASYDRDNSLYPYKSHGQWLKAFYGFAASTILVLFNGIPAFIDEPFNVRRFVSAYAGVSLPHLCTSHTWHLITYELIASCVLSFDIRIQDSKARIAAIKLGT